MSTTTATTAQAVEPTDADAELVTRLRWLAGQARADSQVNGAPGTWQAHAGNLSACLRVLATQLEQLAIQHEQRVARNRHPVKRPLTKQQRRVLAYLRAWIAARPGEAPTVAELQQGLGLSSPGTVSEHLATLTRKGHITREPRRPRSILLVD